MSYLGGEKAAGRRDVDLASAGAKGDDAAFAELYARYLQVARRSARRAARTHPQLDVDEVANMALTRLWEVLPQFDPSQDFAPWAAVVISHAVRTAARATRSAKSTMNWGAMLSRTADPDTDRLAELQAFPSGDGDAAAPVVLAEEERLVAALLEQVLSPREAKVVRLRLAGWSYAEIAERMDLSVKAVDNAQRRGMGRLREALGTTTGDGVITDARHR